MTDRIPTDAEAAWLRKCVLRNGAYRPDFVASPQKWNAYFECRLAEWCKPLVASWFELTPAGIAALARYDATCRKCGGAMRPGIATGQTYVGGVPDFPGDTHAGTFSAGGPGEVINVRKCEKCGWSVTG